MPQTWQSEEAGIQECKECARRYKVTITTYPCRDSDEAYCICGTLLKSWNSTDSYSFTLLDEGKMDNR